MNQRFQLRGIEEKGYPVARIHDRALDKDYLIYRRGSRFFHWNRQDLKVDNPTLRRVAREALDGALA
jgi:hypothetical protein